MTILYYRFAIVSNSCHHPRHQKQHSLLAVKAGTVAAKDKDKGERERSRSLCFLITSICLVRLCVPGSLSSLPISTDSRRSKWQNVPTVAPGIPSKRLLMFRRVPLVARA